MHSDGVNISRNGVNIIIKEKNKKLAKARLIETRESSI